MLFFLSGILLNQNEVDLWQRFILTSCHDVFIFLHSFLCPFPLFGAASQNVLHHSQKTLLTLCIAALYLSNINRETTSLASDTEIRTALQSSKALVHPAFGTSGGNRRQTKPIFAVGAEFCRPCYTLSIKLFSRYCPMVNSLTISNGLCCWYISSGALFPSPQLKLFGKNTRIFTLRETLHHKGSPFFQILSEGGREEKHKGMM